jgi:TPR repeat protein
MRTLPLLCFLLCACNSDKPGTGTGAAPSGAGSSSTPPVAAAPNDPDASPEEADCRSSQTSKSVDRCVELCKSGFGNACYVAGTSYADGDRTERDATKAFRNFELGCRLDSGTACKRAAAISATGVPGDGGFKANAERAAGMYEKARARLSKECERKRALSCSELAGMFDEGLGGAADKVAATAHRKRACELGSTADCP